MTTAELNLMINTLSAPEREKVSRYVSKLLAKRKPVSSLKRLTKKDILKTIKANNTEIAAGKTIPYQTVLADLRKKYGIPD